jgi:hypothetical protein
VWIDRPKALLPEDPPRVEVPWLQETVHMGRMWYSVGIALSVVGALCVMAAGALVLDDTMATNERCGAPWHEGVGGWTVLSLLGFTVEVAGFVLALEAS